MCELSLSLQGVTLHSQKLVKLLGVLIDRGLRFNEHVSHFCKKAAQPLNSLSRLKHINKFGLFVRKYLNMPYCLTLNVFNSALLSSALYGCES